MCLVKALYAHICPEVSVNIRSTLSISINISFKIDVIMFPTLTNLELELLIHQLPFFARHDHDCDPRDIVKHLYRREVYYR